SQDGRARSFGEVAAYAIDGGELLTTFADGERGGPADLFLGKAVLAGYTGDAHAPASILLEHHGLGIELLIDRNHPIGSTDPAGVADVILESAVTSIMDFEDSIAAVDSADKALAYHNWLGLTAGTLTEQVTKNGQTFTRRLAEHKTYTTADGGAT